MLQRLLLGASAASHGLHVTSCQFSNVVRLDPRVSTGEAVLDD